MFGLFGIKKTVSVGELEVGDRIRLDTFKNAEKTYYIDATITEITASEQLDGFYWIFLDKGTPELMPIDRQIQLLKRAKK